MRVSEFLLSIFIQYNQYNEERSQQAPQIIAGADKLPQGLVKR